MYLGKLPSLDCMSTSSRLPSSVDTLKKQIVKNILKYQDYTKQGYF